MSRTSRQNRRRLDDGGRQTDGSKGSVVFLFLAGGPGGGTGSLVVVLFGGGGGNRLSFLRSFFGGEERYSFVLGGKTGSSKGISPLFEGAKVFLRGF